MPHENVFIFVRVSPKAELDTQFWLQVVYLGVYLEKYKGRNGEIKTQKGEKPMTGAIKIELLI